MPTTLVELLFQNILALFPFVIIRTYQRGVRWRFGKDPIALEPGLHWKVWVFHQVEVSDITDEFIELPVQTVTTKDRKFVCFSVNVGYRIKDIVKHWENVQDFVETTHAAAMTHLARRVREQSLDELELDLSKLEKSLEGTLETKFRNWGTEVFSVGFTNFAEVPRQMRVFLDGKTVLPHSNTH